jgi:hypothetical protein
MEENTSAKDLLKHISQYVLSKRRIKQFLNRRFFYINENKYPLMLTTDPASSRIIIHLIPQSFLEKTIDIKKGEQPDYWFIPLGVTEQSCVPDFNFDGIIFHSGLHEKQTYTQLFRNGIVEIVSIVTELDQNQHPNKVISLLYLQTKLVEAFSQYLKILDKLGVPTPINVFIRLIDVEDLRLRSEDVVYSQYDAKGRNRPLTCKRLEFPVYKIKNFTENIDNFLYTIFDILWNTFGFLEAPRE